MIISGTMSEADEGLERKDERNKKAHEAVLTLLFADILTSEQANKLHAKIDRKIKKCKREKGAGE